jgi:predicted Rossmann fold nucleotide-binding protein DprA/Smf involved in DNA uptake
MATLSNLDLLRRLRAAVARASELEIADLDRQIAAIERAKPRPPSATPSARDSEQALLRVMQEAGAPLPPREIAQRLDVPPATASRWLVVAMRRGFIERVSHARYQVRKEVPPM